MANVGFIGTGVMGQHMARHLMDAGHQLFVFNRTKEKAHSLIEKGASWCSTPAQVAQQTEFVFTILGYPEDVKTVYLGEEGILAGGKEGLLYCDMTTSQPQLAIEIWQKAQKKNVDGLDAPVSGGDVGAKNAALTIMVGGSTNTYQKFLPFLQCMGKNIVHLGDAGAGQHTKMCNQIVIAGGMMGMIESLLYAKKNGLDQTQVLSAIRGGAAGSWGLDNLAPRILKEDFAPGFFIKHFVKDMKIALEEAESAGLKTPCLELALNYYEKACQHGGADLGTQGLYKVWEENPEM